MTINFDNAATTFPKPPEVRLAVERAVRQYGNAGRGGHPIAARTSELVYSAREEAASFFDTEPEQVVFTMNCTHALNLAIQGLAKNGGHFIISSLEHNSVLRPVYALAKEGRIRYSIATVKPTAEETFHNFVSLATPDTKAIICTLASNVTGQILPWKMLGAFCQSRGICFVGDAAQAAGVLPISLKQDGINILCTAGHKGLYGITGTGLLLSDGKFPLPPLMRGGSGSFSNLPDQPDMMPDVLESGTPNVIGAASIRAGIRFVKAKGISNIYRTETALCNALIQEFSSMPEITVFRNPESEYVPILSFLVEGEEPEETAAFLAKKGYCLRAGLHCAPLAHHTLGTPSGTVRFSPSVFSRLSDIPPLAAAAAANRR